MSDAVSVLSAAGVQRGGDVVALAAAAGLDLAAAAALLLKESSGGLNIWGHDPVRTGGIYTPGGPVTQAAYSAYHARRAELGAQGVGPCQLTDPSLQDRADRAGGCWDWTANVRTGFAIFAGYVAAHGLHDGAALFNAGRLYGQLPAGHPGRVYADDLVARADVLRGRLGVPAALPTLRLGDHSPSVAHLQSWSNAEPWSPPLPLLTVDGVYGPATQRVIAGAQAQMGVTGPDADGSIVGARTNAALWSRGYRG